MVLLAWWFLINGETGFAGATHMTGTYVMAGPFVDQRQCEQVREWALDRKNPHERRASWCWWDGKP